MSLLGHYECEKCGHEDEIEKGELCPQCGKGMMVWRSSGEEHWRDDARDVLGWDV